MVANAQLPVAVPQPVSVIPGGGLAAHSLALDPPSDRLYVGTDNGLFLSRDGGLAWAPLEVMSLSPSALAVDAKSAGVFGVNGQQLFYWAPDRWQLFNLAAQTAGSVSAPRFWLTIWGLAIDARQGLLYVGSQNHILRSRDSGATWESVGSLPADCQALVADEKQRAVYAVALMRDELYLSRDGGRSWLNLADGLAGLSLGDLTAWNRWGALGRWSDGSLIWVTDGSQGVWKLPGAILDARRCAVRPRSGSQTELLCAWGFTLLRMDLQTMPLPWVVVRLWVWQLTLWLTGHLPLIGGGLASVLCLGLALTLLGTYINVTRPWGLPLWAAWLTPRQPERYAPPAKLEAAWPAWERCVRAELAGFGEVRMVDLVDIPAPFRRYALERYTRDLAPREWLEARPACLRLRPEAPAQRWRKVRLAQRLPASDWEDAGAPAVEPQAKLFAETLGVNLGAARSLAGAEVYLSDAFALPGAAPVHLQLIWLEAAWVGTVEGLADLLHRSPDDIILLVLPPGETGAAELRQALIKSLRVGNLVMLCQDELARVLLAREPRRVLADLMAEQA